MTLVTSCSSLSQVTRQLRPTAAQRPPRTPQASRATRLLLAVILALGGLLVTLTAHPAGAAPSNPASPAADRGSWAVRDLGAGRWAVSWQAPERLPVSSDRPTIVGPAGLAVGTPTVAADRRTVRAVVTSPSAPAPGDLDVLLSGRTLDSTASSARRQAPAAAADPTPAVRELATDPGVPGPYAVVTSNYTRTPVKVAGMAEPIEMVGHVVEPVAAAATGPRPLVLFLHGRHEYCYQVSRGAQSFDWPCRGTMAEIPSHLGYDYAQRLLASQGFTTVSVRVNGINAQDDALDDGGAGARATIVTKHLDYWTAIAGQHQVDLDQVVLVGHSRGGEGVDRASIRIPATAAYRIVGQVLIAPTDFATQTAPYVPTVTLLPYCDGDVSDLQGQRFTDASRDLTSNDQSLKSSVLVMGANHNYFNTEWTPGLAAAPANDDWYGEADAACGTATSARLTPAEQQAVGKAYIAGAVQQFTAAPEADQPFLPLFDGSAVRVGSTGDAVVLSHALGGGRELRRPADGTALTLPDGAQSEFCTGSTSDDFRPGLCGSELAGVVTPHWPWREELVPTRSFWQLSWDAAGQSAGLQLARPLDLRSRSLDLRTIVDPQAGDVALQVRLTDGAGASATLTPVGGATVRTLLTAEDLTKLWAQDVRVDPSSAVGSLDLAHIVRVDIVGQSTAGRVWVADAAAVPERAPAAVAFRAPALSLGTARVQEGKRSGTTVAQVPFQLSKPLTVPGQFRVLTSGEDEGSLRTFTVDLAAGQSSGTIPVGYQADTVDDRSEATTYVAAWATSNITTDAYIGRLVVLDDDPTPKATVTRVHRTVKEGSSAQWKITFAKAVDYGVDVSSRVVAGPGRDLTGADVSATWLSQHASKRGSTGTLAKLGVQIYAYVPAGSRSTTLSIPIRKDGKKEKGEAVTLRVHALTTTKTTTVKIAASR